MFTNILRKRSSVSARTLVYLTAILFGVMMILYIGFGSPSVHPDRNFFYRVKVPFCNCTRDTSLRREDRSRLRNSSCPISVLRGTGQRVLAYSFYDDPHTSDALNRNFFQGIRENLEGIKELYNKELVKMDPENHKPFSMRLYFQLHSTSKNKDKLCNLACSEPLLDICEISHSTKLYPMIYRFLPIGDAEVDFSFSRDLDSRISPREIHAVHEFISSNKSIHVMRDHMNHGTEILGGMWGVRLDNPSSRERIVDVLRRILKDPIAFRSRTKAGHDQDLLSKYMWPLVRNMGLSHDSYHCKRFGPSRPFPSKRPEEVLNFVGAVADVNNTIEFLAKNECPFQCRPEKHKDWAFC